MNFIMIFMHMVTITTMHTDYQINIIAYLFVFSYNNIPIKEICSYFCYLHIAVTCNCLTNL